MEKILQKKTVGEAKCFNGEYWGNEPKTTITEMEDWLMDVKHSGATHIEWSCYEKEIEAQAFYETVESDEDFERRLREDSIRKTEYQKFVESQEKAQYLKLKEKYESKI